MKPQRREHAGGTPKIARVGSYDAQQREHDRNGAYGELRRELARAGHAIDPNLIEPVDDGEFDRLCQRMDGAMPASKAAQISEEMLAFLRQLLEWVRGDWRFRGQRTRLYVLFRVFLPHLYQCRTDLSMARECGVRRKQSFNREKLEFMRRWGYLDRTLRSKSAVEAMRRAYRRRNGK